MKKDIIKKVSGIIADKFVNEAFERYPDIGQETLREAFLNGCMYSFSLR